MLFRMLERTGLVLSRHAWLVLVTLALFLGATVAFLKAEHRVAGLRGPQGATVAKHGAVALDLQDKPAPLARVPVEQVLNVGDGTRLCGSVDVHVRDTTPHGQAIALLQRLNTVIVDGPDSGGIIRLRVFDRDPRRVLDALHHSSVLDAVTELPACR